MSLALWRISVAHEFQDIKDQLATFGHDIEEPMLRALISYAQHANEQHLFLLAIGTSLVGVIRYTEAFGLWTVKRWAEIVALAGSLIYIPIEVVSLSKEFSLIVLLILITNVAISAYLGWTVTYRQKRA